VNLSASYLSADRSGYRLPYISPNITTGLYSGDVFSKDDKAAPVAAFGTFKYKASDEFNLSAQVNYSHLQSYGEFSGFRYHESQQSHRVG
jgi:hypothetical protein